MLVAAYYQKIRGSKQAYFSNVCNTSSFEYSAPNDFGLAFHFGTSFKKDHKLCADATVEEGKVFR